MQELTFEQVGIVAGGEGGDTGDNSGVETNTIKVKVDATGAQTVIVGIGAALGTINPWLGVAGSMYAFYVTSQGPTQGGTAYPTYQGGAYNNDPLL